MCCEFRAIWIFHQTSAGKGGEIKLVLSRRFKTVESRLKVSYLKAKVPLSDLPDNEDVRDQFVSCIIKEGTGPRINIETMSNSAKSELDGPVFLYETGTEMRMSEKYWPLGPTCVLGQVWPFIYVSSDGIYEEVAPSDSGRYFVCGVVGVPPSSENRPLLSLPEVTSGFGVLEGLIDFLPSPKAISFSAMSSSKLLVHLKTVMPFGSPMRMSEDFVKKLSSNGAADSAIQSQTNGQSGNRIPAWKPFPSSVCSGSLKLHVVESVSFEIAAENTILYSSAVGKVFCEADLVGTPEVIIPMSSITKLKYQLHDCAKVTETAGSVVKISMIPLLGHFTMCDFECSSSKEWVLPIEGSFRLFQISPQQFRFSLFIRLKILFAQLSVVFGVNSNSTIRILATPHIAHSAKTKVDHVDASLVWTFRTPATYNPEGELLDGVIETDRALVAGEVLSRSACINFRTNECFFSKLTVLKENISIFPNSLRTHTSVSYEMVSNGACHVVNSALGTEPLANSQQLNLNSDNVDLANFSSQNTD